MIYPQKLSNKKNNLIIKLGLLIAILIIILLSIINIFTSPEIPWAAIANGGIIYILAILFYSIKKKINIAGHVLLHGVAFSSMAVYIDYLFGFKAWSINIIIPIIIIVSNIAMFILTIICHKQFIKYAIYQLLIVVFSIIPIILIAEGLIQNRILSIIAIIISVINFIVSLVWCTKDIKETVIRKFHM